MTSMGYEYAAQRVSTCERCGCPWGRVAGVIESSQSGDIVLEIGQA